MRIIQKNNQHLWTNEICSFDSQSQFIPTFLIGVLDNKNYLNILYRKLKLNCMTGIRTFLFESAWEINLTICFYCERFTLMKNSLTNN